MRVNFTMHTCFAKRLLGGSNLLHCNIQRRDFSVLARKNFEWKMITTSSRRFFRMQTHNFNQRLYQQQGMKSNYCWRGFSTGVLSLKYSSGFLQTENSKLISDIFKADRYRQFIDAINIDTRMRLGLDEFNRLAEEFGFNAGDVETVRKNMSKMGIILDFGDKHKLVIIKPERVLKMWEEASDVKLSFTSKLILDKKMELDNLRNELKPLEEVALKIEHDAERFTDWCMKSFFVYAIAYSGVLTWAIFWTLSWDVMEPVTYLLGMFNVALVLYFFNATSAEYSLGSMKNAIKLIKSNRSRKRLKFNELEYQRIQQKIREVEIDLQNPEWLILNEVSKEMNRVELPDPVKFSEERTYFKDDS